MFLEFVWMFCRFSVQLDEDHVVEMVPQIILQAKYGIKLKFNLLNDNCTE